MDNKIIPPPPHASIAGMETETHDLQQSKVTVD